MKTHRALLAVLAVLAAVAAPAASREGVSSLCIGCICQAVSECDLTRECAAGVCGPFHISKGYYVDANINREEGFEEETYHSCAKNPFCSALAIRKYMDRYARDCDGDGKVTCADFALIHKLGSGGCSKHGELTKSIYWERLQDCLGYYPNA